MNRVENEAVIDAINTWAIDTAGKAWRAKRRIENSPDDNEAFSPIDYPLIMTDQIGRLRVSLWEAVQGVNFLYNAVADWHENRKAREEEEIGEGKA